MITRDESHKNYKELEKILPSQMDRLCVIVDDLIDVWHLKLKSVVQVVPFLYFGDGINRAQAEEQPDLYFLAFYLRVLHKRFFESKDAAVSIQVSSKECHFGKERPAVFGDVLCLFFDFSDRNRHKADR